MQVQSTANIPYLERREDYFDLLDGMTSVVPENIEKRKLPAGLQKTYLLETASESNTDSPSVQSIFRRSKLACESIKNDDGIFRIIDAAGNGLALLERVTDRYLMLYTLLPASQSDKLVRGAVACNPWLDHLWISSQTFLELWDRVRTVNSGRRYGKVTFEHESVFDVIQPDGSLESNYEDERRASRFTMVDRLEVISRQMEPLSNVYAPLASITHLRLPATNSGGHDLYYDGKATNRSSSFFDHRSALQGVVQMYSGLTDKVEQCLWVSDEHADPREVSLNSAVAELIFSEELSEDTFRRWMINLFNHKRNRFRIGGYANWLSSSKVHANAIDQHLWQPLLLEFTRKRVVAVLPEGTCGNTINRLISNVQRYVDPRVSAYIGEVEYSSLIPNAGMAQVG